MEYIGGILLINFVFALFAAHVASNKSRSGIGFFALGLVLGPIALIAALISGPGQPPAPPGWSAVFCPRCNARQNVPNGIAFTCWQCQAHMPAGWRAI